MKLSILYRIICIFITFSICWILFPTTVLSDDIASPLDCGEAPAKCTCGGIIKCWSGISKIKECNFPNVTITGGCASLSSSMMDVCQANTAKEFNKTVNQVSCRSSLICTAH